MHRIQYIQTPILDTHRMQYLNPSNAYSGWYNPRELGLLIANMMTSSNENKFRVTGHLCGEFTGHRWNPRTKASGAELWCFLWSAPWINGWVNNLRLVIWDAIALIVMGYRGSCLPWGNVLTFCSISISINDTKLHICMHPRKKDSP